MKRHGVHDLANKLEQEKHMSSSRLVLGWTIGLSVAVGIYQATMFYLGFLTSPEFNTAWGYAFVGMLAFWVDADSRGRPEIDRPSFDIGMFVGLIWLICLPYYLLRTRGKKGWLWILGLFLLALLGTLLQWGIYAARYQ